MNQSESNNQTSMGKATIEVEAVLNRESLVEQIREAVREALAAEVSAPDGERVQQPEPAGDRRDYMEELSDLFQREFDRLAEAINARGGAEREQDPRTERSEQADLSEGDLERMVAQDIQQVEMVRLLEEIRDTAQAILDDALNRAEF